MQMISLGKNGIKKKKSKYLQNQFSNMTSKATIFSNSSF